MANYWLPRRLATFHAANPGVQLEVVIRNTREVESAVVGGDAHLGLVEGPTQHRSLVRLQVDTDRPLLVVAADQPPLPRNESDDIDLRAIPWVVREEGSGTRHVLEELAARQGLSLNDLNIFLVLPGNEAVREAVEERSLDDLALAERFETRFLETPALDPRAFAVNATTGKLYVAYTNKAILEVFPLD